MVKYLNVICGIASSSAHQPVATCVFCATFYALNVQDPEFSKFPKFISLLTPIK